MLYGKKLNLRKLYEWGNQVWIHTPGGSKLDGRSRMGKWIGYDEISNGHRIYWPDKHSVTVEHSVKFSNDEVILPSIPVAQPIQGELAVGKTTKNQLDDSKREMEEHTKDKELTDDYEQLENPVQAQMKVQVPLEQPTTSRSR